MGDIRQYPASRVRSSWVAPPSCEHSVPAGHSLHVPSSVKKKFFRQSVHPVAIAVEKVFPGQSEQDAEPSRSEKLPGTQAVQLVCPDAGWACPLRHSTHAVKPDCGATFPDAHGEQASLAAAEEKYPGMHSRQVRLPEVLNFPGRQDWHSAASPSEKYPALQGLHVVALVAVLVKEPAPQDKQAPVKG